jgi:hypothetical protein
MRAPPDIPKNRRSRRGSYFRAGQDQAGTQHVAERTAFRAMLEQGSGHEDSMPGMIRTTLGRQAGKAVRSCDPASLEGHQANDERNHRREPAESPQDVLW